MELAWNTQKNQMSDVKGKEREQDRSGKIKNEDIDRSRTKHNYDLVQSNLNLYQRVKARVEDLKKEGSRVQKNSVVMYSNILTVSEEQANAWGEEKTKAYFESCHDYFAQEFGQENVVSAKVHLDETAPHMHLHFVPVNKQNGRLQARVAMNKAKINHIHDALPKFLQERGFDVQRGSGKTKDKNIENVHEYKVVQKKIQEKENELKTLIDVVPNAKERIPFKKETTTQVVKKGLLHKETVEKETGNVIIPKKDFEGLINKVHAAAAMKNDYVRIKNLEPLKENEKLKREKGLFHREYEKVLQENNQLRSRVSDLKKNNTDLFIENSTLKSHISSLQANLKIIYKTTKKIFKDQIGAFMDVLKGDMDKNKVENHMEKIHEQEKKKVRQKNMGLER